MGSISHTICYGLKEALGSTEEEVFLTKDGILFPMYIHHKGCERWIIFFGGAFTRKYKIPAFMRKTYAPLLEANVICLFDPTLYFHSELRVGWFFGDERRHYIKVLGELLKSSFKEMDVDTSKIVIYGSSAGGLPAVFLASYLENCQCFISNAQTNILKYYRFYQPLFEAVFHTKEYEKIASKYQNRVSCYDVDGVFELYVLQNIFDSQHYSRHFLPYFEYLESKEVAFKYFFLTFEDEEAGHGVIKWENIFLGILSRGMNFIPMFKRNIKRVESKKKYEINLIPYKMEVLQWLIAKNLELEQTKNAPKPQIKEVIKEKVVVKEKPIPSIYLVAKDRIHNHLAYKLGQAMILNSKSLLGYIRMPYVLSYIKESHKKEIADYEARVAKNPDLKLPKLESYPDYKEALREKECFTYKLGESLIAANSVRGGGRIFAYLAFFQKVRELRKELREKRK